jgi:hypothetical protein
MQYKLSFNKFQHELVARVSFVIIGVESVKMILTVNYEIFYVAHSTP